MDYDGDDDGNDDPHTARANYDAPVRRRRAQRRGPGPPRLSGLTVVCGLASTARARARDLGCCRRGFSVSV